MTIYCARIGLPYGEICQREIMQRARAGVNPDVETTESSKTAELEASASSCRQFPSPREKGGASRPDRIVSRATGSPTAYELFCRSLSQVLGKKRGKQSRGQSPSSVGTPRMDNLEKSQHVPCIEAPDRHADPMDMNNYDEEDVGECMTSSEDVSLFVEDDNNNRDMSGDDDARKDSVRQRFFSTVAGGSQSGLGKIYSPPVRSVWV